MNKLSDKSIGLITVSVEILLCLIAYLLTKSYLVCNIVTFNSIFIYWLRSILSKKIKFNGFCNWIYISSLILVGSSIVYNDILYLKLRFTLTIAALTFILIFYPIYDPKASTFTHKFISEHFPNLKDYFNRKQIRELNTDIKIFCITILITNIIIMVAYSSEAWLVFKTVVFPVLLVLYILLELLVSGYISATFKFIIHKIKKWIKHILGQS